MIRATTKCCTRQESYAGDTLSLKMSSAGTPIITRNTSASVDTIKLTINSRYQVTYYSPSAAVETRLLGTSPTQKESAVFIVIMEAEKQYAQR